MEKQENKICVKDLTEEIAMLIKDEMIATYTKDERGLQIHFLNGQNFIFA